MTTTGELKAQAAALELAKNLLTMGGNVALAGQARNELMAIYSEIERRKECNKLQTLEFKKAKGGK